MYLLLTVKPPNEIKLEVPSKQVEIDIRYLPSQRIQALKAYVDYARCKDGGMAESMWV